MTKKQTASPICEIYRFKDDGSTENIGTLYQWNTGEKEMRWKIKPKSFKGGQLGRVSIPPQKCSAIAAAGAS